MNKNELWRLYCERDKEFEKAKGRRALITIAAFAVVYFLIIYTLEKPVGWKWILGDLVFALILGGIRFLIDAIVFCQLFDVAEKERKVLENIKKQMSELE